MEEQLAGIAKPGTTVKKETGKFMGGKKSKWQR